MRGKFIVFEGIDGSGKTTQLELLEKYMDDNCEWVITTKEPWDGDRNTFIWIRKILDKEIKIKDRTILEMLLWKNRYEHCKWMKRVLDMGVNVLCDRYWYSSIAYQELFSMDLIININKRMLIPDVVIYVETPATVAMERIKNRGEKTTLYEKTKKLEDANQRYYQFFRDTTLDENSNIVPKNGYIIVDGRFGIDYMHDIICSRYNRR